jgi:5'-methylthioadenosine phosphorylase
MTRSLSYAHMRYALACIWWFVACSAVFAEDFTSDIAIIGGTHLRGELFERRLLDEGFVISTPLGESPRIYRGQYKAFRFYYVPAHGSGKWLETWWALAHLRVTEAFGGGTAGGINPTMKRGDYVVPDDLIDLNADRPKALPRSAFPMLPTGLVRYNPPIDTELHRLLGEESSKRLAADPLLNSAAVHRSAVLVQAKGGRFETAAEVRMMKQMGGDVVTANVGSEMVYARQAGIHYACLILVSNPAEGMGAWDFADLREARKSIPVTADILLAALTRVPELKGKPRIGDAQRATPENAQVDPGLSQP